MTDNQLSSTQSSDNKNSPPNPNPGLTADEQVSLIEFAMDRAADSTILLCPEGRILFATQGAAQLLQCARSELIQAELFRFVPALEKDWPKSFNSLKLREPGKKWQIRNAKGIETSVEWKVYEHTIDNRTFTLLILVNDAAQKEKNSERETAAKQISSANEHLSASNRQLEKSILLAEKFAREAKIAGQAKTAFLESLSYEIRTPMNVIVGMLSLLKDTPVNEEQTDYLQTAEYAAGRLMAVVNDIIDLSQIESRQLDFDKISFNLADVLDQALDGYAGRVQEKGVELTCVIEKDVPLSLLGDPRRFRRLLENLIENSVSLIERGEINVEISLDKRTETTAEIRFLVADTGPGLSSDVIHALTDSATDGDFGAHVSTVGFGMTLARQIAAVMGAEIAAVNDDRGAAVWFTVSFEIEKESPSEIPEGGPLSECEIVVADDNMSVRRAISLCAVDIGCRVKETSTATDLATRIHLSKARFSERVTVLVDVDMPAVAQALKPNGALPPFITLVGLVPKAGFQEGRGFAREDFAAFLTKPIKRVRLIRTLNRILRSSDIAKPPTERSAVEGIKHDIKILVVEDNENNQKVAKNLLRRMGYSVEIAVNGKEALDRLREKDFSLVFMDIQMPVMDGREATKIIRSSDSEVKNHAIPIIAMTAHAFEEDKAECLAAGMNDYMTKPVEPDLIRAMVEKFTSSTRHHKETV